MQTEKMRVLNDKILFQFMEDVAAGGFGPEQTKSGIKIISNKENQVGKPRWAKVLKIGRDVKLVSEGEYALVEPLRWTNGIDHEGEKVWMTDEQSVLVTTDTAPEEF